MQIPFITIAVSGLIYFLFAKRRFDLFSVAYLGSCVYFLPGFYGHARYPFASGDRRMPLVSETYWVMIAVCLTVLAAAIIYDLFGTRREIKVVLRDAHYAPQLATALAIVGFTMAILTSGDALFHPNKLVVLSQMNRWHILWVFGASIGAVLAFSERRYVLLGICTVLLLVDVYLGFRMAFALTTGAVFTIYMSGRGDQRLAIDSWRPLVIGLAGGILIIVYKSVYNPIKRGQWATVWERLTSRDFFSRAITDSEPFTSQAVLNRVIESDFHVGTDHFSELVYRVVAFAPELGARTTTFNSQFQPNLFPGHQAGMGSNIWAEMWSAGGWSTLLLFLTIFGLSLALGSRLMAFRDRSVVSLISLLGMYWAFYIHRNEIGFEINLLRRVFFVWLAVVVLSVLAVNVLGSPRRKQTTGRQPRTSPNTVAP